MVDGDVSIIEVSSTIKAHAEPSTEEGWNFAASAAAAVTDVAMTSTPLLPRRAAKSVQSQAATLSNEVIAPGIKASFDLTVEGRFDTLIS